MEIRIESRDAGKLLVVEEDERRSVRSPPAGRRRR